MVVVKVVLVVLAVPVWSEVMAANVDEASAKGKVRNTLALS